MVLVLIFVVVAVVMVLVLLLLYRVFNSTDTYSCFGKCFPVAYFCPLPDGAGGS